MRKFCTTYRVLPCSVFANAIPLPNRQFGNRSSSQLISAADHARRFREKRYSGPAGQSHVTAATDIASAGAQLWSHGMALIHGRLVVVPRIQMS